MNNLSQCSFTSLSICNPAKKRCGDKSFTDIIRINQEDCVVLLVADGVSRSPKDWLASSSIVNIIINELKNSGLSVAEAFKFAIKIANNNIFIGIENTRGMLSTLSAVVYQPSSEKLYLCNVGDSRIYGLKNSNWIQLTVDDISSVPYKENGKLKLQNGVPIMLTGISKAIGDSKNIEIVLKEIPISEYEIILLSSDGFYNLLNFEHYANILANALDMSCESIKIKNSLISEINDDASFAILRLPYIGTINLKELVEHDDKNLSISSIAILNELEIVLKKAITSNESDYLDKLLSFMEKKHLFLIREKMIEILELMIHNKCSQVQKMVFLIKKL